METMDGQRRKLLKISGLTAISTALPACGGSSAPPVMCGALSTGVGTASTIAVGEARFIPSIPLYVCRDEHGYYALDACCTHMCCAVEFKSRALGFSCPCHGATYDFNGEKQTAPAPKPMTHYALCIDTNGNILVDTSVEVDASTRANP
jgi:Rieske Fe-S protein